MDRHPITGQFCRQNFLDTLTVNQLYRLYCKAWERMTRGDGYQPFGYDRVTLQMTRPEWLAVLDAIGAAGRRKEQEHAGRRNQA